MSRVTASETFANREKVRPRSGREAGLGQVGGRAYREEVRPLSGREAGLGHVLAACFRSSDHAYTIEVTLYSQQIELTSLRFE